jgi:hypothetical protein
LANNGLYNIHQRDEMPMSITYSKGHPATNHVVPKISTKVKRQSLVFSILHLNLFTQQSKAFAVKIA